MSLPGQLNTHQAEHLKATPSKVRVLFSKVFEGATSPRQAIKAKCLDCSHHDRREISLCGVVTCPLWAYRPFQNEGGLC